MNRKKLYELNRVDRLVELIKRGDMNMEQAKYFNEDRIIPPEIAEHLIENQIGQYMVPEGILDRIMINGHAFTVVMATEEPSVVAAANHGAKLALAGSGFKAVCSEHLMIGQIVYADFKPDDNQLHQLETRQSELQAWADKAMPSIVKRGGGLKSYTLNQVDGFFKIELIIDTKSAMGANIVNTISESVAAWFDDFFQQDHLYAVLTNHAVLSTATATIEIPVNSLTLPGIAGQKIAERICQITAFANLDIGRAATQNKGIMNGIDAVILASGNDTRAVEAGAHSFAARDGRYQSLSRWVLDGDNLKGELTLPLSLGTVGGSISLLEQAQINLEMVQVNDPKQLAEIAISVGLAQNLAAMYALVTKGIQSGHMALQARTLAMQVGATGVEIDQLAQMLQKGIMNIENAKKLLNELRKKN